MTALTVISKGESWDVTYDTHEQLSKRKVTFFQQPTGPDSYNLPEAAGRQMAAEFGLMAAEGAMGWVYETEISLV